MKIWKLKTVTSDKKLLFPAFFLISIFLISIVNIAY